MGGNEPPRLRKGDVYSSWKRKILVWQCGVTLDATKQGSRVVQALEGKALEFATRIALAKIKSENGVELVLQELDKHFKKDETQIAFIAIENLENYKRTDESISDYIEEFSRRKDLVEECECLGADAYKDGILAYRLLKQASLSKSETQLIRATITKLTFENMIVAMKKTLGDVVIMEGQGSNDNIVPIKLEPAYYAEQVHANKEDYQVEDEYSDCQYYANNYFRGRNNSGMYRGNYNGPYNNRGRGNQNFNGRANNSNKFKSKHGQKFTKNPIDQSTGEPYVCHGCHSIYHFKQDCPESSYGGNS